MIDSNALAASVGAEVQATFQVTEKDTAQAVGSGTVAVLGTPVLIAWWESVTLRVLDLPSGALSLGVHVDISHVRATAVSSEVQCSARLTAVDGVRLTFAVTAHDRSGQLLGEGQIHRVVVDEQRFLHAVNSV